MSYVDQFYAKIDRILQQIRDEQRENIEKAADILTETVEQGGIIQAFGSGHSFAATIEVAGRAGGFVNSKAIKEFYGTNGWFEVIEGVGDTFIRLVDQRKEDCFIFISNSGKNPLHIDMAKYIKEQGNKLIVVTNLTDSQNAKSLHSSGKKLYEFADVTLDNCGDPGDCAIDVPEYGMKTGATSSIAAAYLLDSVVLQAIENLVNKGIEPPIMKSANIEGGREYNESLLEKYNDRLNRV
ncbi:SIS domain-containing protein [Gracilibacillus timonensis]|uniref:SIS domain-containing protein n=1 Tax=Gracilibacillus timonensis TaxID=1816696 RepID=UPI000A7B5CF9|nr:SIS domain-containing protein [Gracilibacillus timonensis]